MNTRKGICQGGDGMIQIDESPAGHQIVGAATEKSTTRESQQLEAE